MARQYYINDIPRGKIFSLCSTGKISVSFEKLVCFSPFDHQNYINYRKHSFSLGLMTVTSLILPTSITAPYPHSVDFLFALEVTFQVFCGDQV